MAIARSALAGGPAKVTFSGATLHSEDDIKLNVTPKYNGINSSLHGKNLDWGRNDALVIVPMTLWGAWENLGVIFPTVYTNPTIGYRIMTSADVPVVIHSNNLDKYTLTAGAITKLPDLYLGADKPIFGPMEFTGVVGTNMDMETTESLYKIESGIAFPADTGFSPTNYKQQPYSAAWIGTGFTAFQAQYGWTIQHELMLEPVTMQNRTVDFKIVGYNAMAKCTPHGPTGAQIDAALRAQGAGNTLGKRIGTDGADLVITASGVTITLKNSALQTAGYVFGNVALRPGELGWITTVGFTTGAAQARATFA